jgi:hypothetical protein
VVLQEASPANVTAQLAAALAKPPKRISAAEMAQIRARFAWGALVPAFYERIAAELQCVRCLPELEAQSVAEVVAEVMGSGGAGGAGGADGSSRR